MRKLPSRQRKQRWTGPGERRTFRYLRNYKMPVEPNLKNYKYCQGIDPLGAKDSNALFSNLLLLAVETLSQ